MEQQQTAGQTVYSGDEPELPGTLFAAPVYSTVAVATIVSVDASTALGLDGVVAFFSAKDLKVLEEKIVFFKKKKKKKISLFLGPEFQMGCCFSRRALVCL